MSLSMINTDKLNQSGEFGYKRQAVSTYILTF
jgi:hypothetical protein